MIKKVQMITRQIPSVFIVTSHGFVSLVTNQKFPVSSLVQSMMLNRPYPHRISGVCLPCLLMLSTQKKMNPVFSNVIQLTNSVTSHTRAKHFAVWCGACSPDWARGRFPLAEDQFGMENAPLPVTV
jgi:hypothetical protein